ncbi:ABC transporter substrate-binding protein [Pseudoalteromonas byunsanensis]|uniref:ABC transporter substrate-binding protein n=1 Tax=Pseudoalteromonas byunsanensis TaxID=327939 RepID=A0A1S1MY39_9GAMM|nr:ABC transporter substrate-binding protein [Pseudoalteromonas byunsanensis]OHU93830.1 ABC transporter substrate-binding protein [Pseudoalteromonas byunsanensis]
MRNLLLGVLCTCLLGCIDASQQTIRKTQGLVYCSEANPVSFNPQVTTTGSTIDIIASQLYDTLLSIDPETAEFKPEIAHSWQVSDDGKMVTFYLRKDVQFHHTDYFKPTRLLNADDVVFSFSRLFDVYNPYHFVGDAHYPYFQSVGLDQLIRQVVKVDDYTVRFELFNAESSFLSNLATDFAVILSEEYASHLAALEQKELFDTYPIGTGPYKYKNFLRDNLIRYHRNEHYWKHPVPMQQLVFDITTNGTSRIAKMLTKECDITAHPSATQLSVLAARDDIRVDKAPNLNIGYWAFNTEKPPFDNLLVRKALAHSVDFEKIMQAVFYGNGIIAKSHLPPSSWAFQAQDNMPTYNPEYARQLLVEAGYEDGFSMTLWAMPVSRIYNPNARKMAELIQSDLKGIGISAQIVEYEWNTFIERIGQHEHDSVLLGWAADTPDPDNFFSPLLSCTATFSGKNPANWCNPEFDLLLTQALDTTDVELRKAFYHQAQKMIIEQLPLVPIAHGMRFQATSVDVKDITLRPFGGISLGKARRD